MKPSRYSSSRRFADLTIGDLAYSIHDDGKIVWAVVEQVVRVWTGPRCPVRGGLFATLPCYSDGTPMLYFSMWFRRSSGIEHGDYRMRPPTDRPRVRLYLELPAGIHAASRPQRVVASAALSPVGPGAELNPSVGPGRRHSRGETCRS